MQTDRVFTIPNILSMARLVGVPLFLWLVLSPVFDGPNMDGWALLVLVFSGVSDYLDGKLARRWNQVSDLGRILDPAADRLYILSTSRPHLARHPALVGHRPAAGAGSMMAVTVVVLDRRGYAPPQVNYLARPPPSISCTASRCSCSATAAASSPHWPPFSDGRSSAGVQRSTGGQESCTWSRSAESSRRMPRPTEPPWQCRRGLAPARAANFRGATPGPGPPDGCGRHDCCLPKEDTSDMKAVVMAGGEGTRLRPMTASMPKPLLPVANRPIMEHVLRLLKRHGLNGTVVTVQFLASLVKNYFATVRNWGWTSPTPTRRSPWVRPEV